MNHRTAKISSSSVAATAAAGSSLSSDHNNNNNNNHNNNHNNNNNAVSVNKYGMKSLSENFILTDEEKVLFEMYEIVRTTERVAARLKEEAARNKLMAKNEEFMKLTAAKNSSKNNSKNKNNKKRPRIQGRNEDGKKKHGNNNDNDDDIENDEDDDFVDEEDSDDQQEDDNDNDDDDDDDDDNDIVDEDELYERNEARLEKMREEVEAKKKQLFPKEDPNSSSAAAAAATAATATATADGNNDGFGVGMGDGISILRKRTNNNDLDVDSTSPTKMKQPSSLIANLISVSTPPHDFSKKLDLDSANGTILFPTSTDEFTWVPPEGVFAPNDGAFTTDLDGFDITKAQVGEGNNTVAIKFTAPSESKRFSVNITSHDHNDYDNVLFHFNPRQREKGGQLVVNDKQDRNWGQAVSLPLSQVPLMFGQTSCTLLIQITGEGFDIFVEGKHCARLEHRKEIEIGTNSLLLQFPSTDDYGSPENWIVYKVWWGNRPIMAKGDVSTIAGVNTYNALHPRKLFISGLPKIYNQSDVDIRRAELERAFQKYGGARGAYVIVPMKSTFAFVEFESERQSDLALSEMSTSYRINRARRSKHEALQDERAAKDALKLASVGGGGGGGVGVTKKPDNDWN